jgi:hypothetical protein
MKIIQYKTVRASSIESLDKQVNALLLIGYLLYGSPYIARDTLLFGINYYQAMVKEN